MTDGKFPIPPKLLVLDLIGTLLLVVGIVEWLVEPGMLVPEAWHFPFYAQLMIAAGIALILPLVLYLFELISNQPR